MKKNKIIKDIFENYGSAEIETDFSGSSFEDDKRLINFLNKFGIEYKKLESNDWPGMMVKYYGPYSCLQKLILTFLKSGNETEDLNFLETQFIKNDFLKN